MMPDDWQIRDGRGWFEENPLNVWFAGDCLTADGTVTHAIGNGRKTALAAMASLDGAELPVDEILQNSLVAPAHIRFSHFPVLAQHQDRQRTSR